MSAPLASSRQLKISFTKRLLNALGIWCVLVGLVMAGLLAFPKFGQADNLLNILRNVTLLGIVAIGASFVTYGRHYIDLSIPPLMACVGLVTISAQPLGIGPSLLLGLTAGLAIGLLNGWAVGYLRLNPIIWTLAVSFFLDGFLRWAYAGHQVYPDADTTTGRFFLDLPQRTLPGGIPVGTALMLVLALAGHWLMTLTRFGRQLQLTGIAYDVAALSGVRVRRVVLLTFVLSAFTTSLAGLLLSALNRQGTFDTGQGYDFNAITAVVLGGVLLQGGRGNVLGVLGGVLLIGVLINLMTLLGIGSFGQMVVKGLIFMAVVGLTAWLTRRSGRSDE
ncbi:MAG: ABC transporter permease [Lacunisphaera sp.]|nr:ABC transporter permease [Lacunisphaera sp.]